VEALETGNQHLHVLVTGADITTAGIQTVKADTVLLERPLETPREYVKLQELLTTEVQPRHRRTTDVYLLYDKAKSSDLNTMNMLERDGLIGMQPGMRTD
jgi:hypothetical protein